MTNTRRPANAKCAEYPYGHYRCTGKPGIALDSREISAKSETAKHSKNPATKLGIPLPLSDNHPTGAVCHVPWAARTNEKEIIAMEFPAISWSYSFEYELVVLQVDLSLSPLEKASPNSWLRETLSPSNRF